MLKPNRSSYTAMELLDWTLSKTLSLTPKFQRRGVWQPAARSFFVDTLLRGMPVPPVYMRLTQSPQKDKVVREVIDGQQRISAVTSYMRDEYALSNSLVAPWRGKKFSQLEHSEQDDIRNYPFNAESFQGISDADVLEIFSRLNTYSVPLNNQELRNGKFFGNFKQAAYKLAYEHLEFWREGRIFTERGIARMEEVELVSELLAAAISGPQDGKKSLDTYYSKYDEEFKEKDVLIDRFRSTISTIVQSVGMGIEDTEFHRGPLFYSLFCVVYHRKYGMPSISLPRPAKVSAELKPAERDRLGQAVAYLSDVLVSSKEGAVVEEPLGPFITAATRQTDNIKPRQTRFNVLYTRAFL